jgi:hypothetical protein
MKSIRNIIGGVVAVTTLVCVLTTPVLARTSFSFNFGFGGYYPFYGRAYYPAYYYSCPPPAYYYCQRPVYRYCYVPPVYHYSGGYYYCR